MTTTAPAPRSVSGFVLAVVILNAALGAAGTGLGAAALLRPQDITVHVARDAAANDQAAELRIIADNLQVLALCADTGTDSRYDAVNSVVLPKLSVSPACQQAISARLVPAR